jgi:phosphatidylglycerol:prolipoprotein diacylglycerol transferase
MFDTPSSAGGPVVAAPVTMTTSVGTWAWFQAAAALSSVAVCLVCARRRGPMSGWLVLACGGAVLGALTLDPLLATIGCVVTGGSSPAPSFGRVSSLGAMLGFAGSFAFGASRRGELARALDLVTPGCLVLPAVGRIGCFAAGCDFGLPTHTSWGARYATDRPAFARQVSDGLLDASSPSALLVHPTQLYESTIAFAAAALAAYVLSLPPRTAGRSGAAFTAGTATYLVGRFVVEALRGDRGPGALSVAAWLCLAGLSALVAWRTTPLTRA